MVVESAFTGRTFDILPCAKDGVQKSVSLELVNREKMPLCLLLLLDEEPGVL